MYRFGAVSEEEEEVEVEPRPQKRRRVEESKQDNKESRQERRVEMGGGVAGVVCVQKGEELPRYCAHTQRVWEKIPARCRRQFRDSVRPLLQQYIRAKQHNEQDADPLVQREQLILRLLDIPSLFCSAPATTVE